MTTLTSPGLAPTSRSAERAVGVVTAPMIRRYAMAIGESNPVYFDECHARENGWPDIIAPPGMLSAILGWEAGPVEANLLADGSDPALVLPEVAGMRLMGGGQALAFGVPLVAGDEVTSRRRVVDAYERDTRSGKLFFVVTETAYSNQRGEVLVTCRETLMALPAPGANA